MRQMRPRHFVLALAAVLLDVVGHGEASPAEPNESASSLQALVAVYRQPAPAERGVAVRDRAITIGHLELTFSEGTVFPLRTPGGATLGLFFEGRGRLAYRTDDPVDRQVIETNLARLTTAVFYRDHTVRDAIRKAVIFFAAPLSEDLWSAAEPGGSVALGPDTRAVFDKVWGRILQTYLPYDHLAAEARRAGPPNQYVFAEIEGERETWGYAFDRVRYDREELFLFRKIAGVDIRLTESLSSQVIADGRGRPARAVELRDARLEVLTDDNRKARITSELTLEARRNNLSVIHLGLVNNRDPNFYDWTRTRNGLRVLRVTDASGREVPFSHRYHEVLLELAEPARQGERFRLRFETEGDVLTGMDGERHDNYFELMGLHWFPQPEGWPPPAFTFHLRVRTRKPYVPVASGETTSFREDGEALELETESDKPANNMAVFAGRYRTVEEKHGDVTIRVHFYAMARKNVMETMPKVAGQFLDMFQNLLGPYPFKELEVVEVPEYGFGIAPSGMVLLTTEAYKPHYDSLTRYLSHGINARVAHEVAHQWFGHKAVPADARENWLAESFAEYMSGIAMGIAKPEQSRILGFKEMLAEWLAEAKLCKDAGPIAGANMLGGEEGWDDRFRLLYNRGPRVLHMLRVLVGNDRFFAVMKEFLDRANMGPTKTEDLAEAARKVLKTDMGWFFDQWIGSGGIPEIRVEHRVVAVESGGFALVGRAVQSEGPAFKKIHIPLVLEYAGGKNDVRIVFQERPVTDFRFDLPARPEKVTVDPSQNNLAVYR